MWRPRISTKRIDLRSGQAGDSWCDPEVVNRIDKFLSPQRLLPASTAGLGTVAGSAMVLRPRKFLFLFDDLNFHFVKPAAEHSQPLGRGVGHVDNSACLCWTAIVDPKENRLVGFYAGDFHPGSKGEGLVSGRHFVAIVALAARGSMTMQSIAVVSRQSRLNVSGIRSRAGLGGRW